ncbi:hypothetical protein S70_10985 [Providencia stuartii MRSN 2154]|uniref:Uncharacterized protein n=1 Tax=Providencia stuartii (strain MRSN 2154) TaxID=1157951 RepID=A0A140NN27_PROSM|nr:hypothetical protein S70_10985 [Providencia stuartii MRSN 2154]
MKLMIIIILFYFHKIGKNISLKIEVRIRLNLKSWDYQTLQKTPHIERMKTPYIYIYKLRY